MNKSAQYKSAVARLLDLIQAEEASAKLAMQGFSSGSATHQVIAQKTVRMYELQEELAAIVGTCQMTILVDMKLSHIAMVEVGVP